MPRRVSNSQNQNNRPIVINRGKPQNNLQPNWCALNPNMPHPFDDNTQDAGQVSQSFQHSYETITIRDSCDVNVTTTETQAAINLQVALQAAIALVISISIADSDQAEMVTQDLQASLTSSQFNRQETYIENSRGVNVTTTDTDIAVNAQLLLQVLIALLVRLDIL